VSFRDFFVVRLAWAVFGLWLAVTVVFVITRVLGPSPAEICKYAPDNRQLECFQSVREELDVDEPALGRYLHYLRRLVADQSPGHTFATSVDSGQVARHALPATASLVTGALVLALALAAAGGLAWSRAAAKWNRLIRLPLSALVGLTPVFLGLLLSFYVGFKWNLTPVVGYCDFFNPPRGIDCGGARDWLSHLVLPVITLSLYFGAIYTRIARGGIADINAAPDVKRKRELRRRFVLVVARVAGRDFGWAIGLAMLVETLFQIPGLGRTAVVSVSNVDLILLEAVVLYAAFLGIAVHFVVDVLVGALDPDLRAEWPVAGMPKPT
jgi:peptide/nickel transport system permease protein